MNDTGPSGIAKLKDLIEGIDFAMLTTLDAHGELHARPMTLNRLDDDGTMWFFTSNDGNVAREAGGERVNVAFSEPKNNTYVSVAGSASIVRDRAKIEALWTPALKAWFPDGPTDPRVALLHVAPTTAAYWDAPSSTLVTLYGMAKAFVTHERPALGEKGVVEVSPDALS